jgi:hypothetical protein
VKGRSASRTSMRGLDLNEDFFDSEGSSSEPSPYLTKLSGELAKSGKELAKLTQEEGSMRTKLAEQIAKVQQIVEKSRINKAEVDIEAFVKANSGTKEVNDLIPAATKYVEFVNTMNEKIEDVYANLEKVHGLVRGTGAEDLKNEKLVEHEVEDYGEALNNVAGTIDDKLAAGKAVQRLFKDDYKDGQRWKSLIATLEGIKAAAKSGRVLQDSGAKLDKALKA